MIARPLELAARLRTPPRSFDAFFYVNVAALGLFFLVFGSRFVLAPGLGFEMPAATGARAGAVPTRYYLSVLDSGQILADAGPLNWIQLEAWLQAKARATPGGRASLLIRAGPQVPSSTVARIVSMAQDAGLNVTWGAEEPDAASPAER